MVLCSTEPLQAETLTPITPAQSAQLQAVMIEQELWELTSPPAEALLSKEPFAIDTLTLPQWLQFIFIPRMRELIEANASLPTGFAITPYAEEIFKSESELRQPLLKILREIDGVG